MRLRLRYGKAGKIRFTSHRDVARAWERALRRVGLPVAYSGGFSPRPKLSFGLALPTGAESVAEYLDVELEPHDPAPLGDDLPAALSPTLPSGIDVLAAAVVDPRAPSLQESVTSCSWRIEAAGLDVGTAEELVDRALAADQLLVTRKRKGKEVTDDLLPAILSLSVTGPTDHGVELGARLAVHPRSVRPSELLTAVDPGLVQGRVCRTHQWIERDGAREEPLLSRLPLPATSAACAEVRA